MTVVKNGADWNVFSRKKILFESRGHLQLVEEHVLKDNLNSRWTSWYKILYYRK